MCFTLFYRSKRNGPFTKTTKPAGASILKDTSRKRGGGGNDDDKKPTTSVSTKSDVDVDSTDEKSSVSTLFKPEDTSSVCSTSEKDVDKSLLSTNEPESVEISSANPQEESGYDSDQVKIHSCF